MIQRVGILLFAGALITNPPCSAVGEEPDPVERARTTKTHTHDLRRIDARPIIRRLHVPLNQPRRVCVTKKNAVVISDWGAGAVLRFDDGDIEILARDLNEPSGIAFDRAGNLFVSTFAGGKSDQGQVVRVTATGQQEVIISRLTGATDVEVARDGRLYVAEFNANRISRYLPSGEREWTTDIDSPSGLAFDAQGKLCITSSNAGKVHCLQPSGVLKELCAGLDTPSDLAVNADGRLVAVNFGAQSLVSIENGTFRKLAAVPEGTIAIDYRPDGNFVVLNWDLQSATQVRNRISIPCPHCGHDIPVLLKPKRRPAPVL